MSRHRTSCHMATFFSHFSLLFCTSSCPAKILVNTGQKGQEWKSRAKQPFSLPVLSGHPSCSCYCRLVPKVFLSPPRDRHASLSLPLPFPVPHTWLCFPPAGFRAFYHSPPDVGCWSTPRSANHNPSYLIITNNLQLHAPPRANAPLLHTLPFPACNACTHMRFDFSMKPVSPWHHHCSKACQHSLHRSLSEGKKGKLMGAHACPAL